MMDVASRVGVRKSEESIVDAKTVYAPSSSHVLPCQVIEDLERELATLV